MGKDDGINSLIWTGCMQYLINKSNKKQIPNIISMYNCIIFINNFYGILSFLRIRYWFIFWFLNTLQITIKPKIKRLHYASKLTTISMIELSFYFLYKLGPANIEYRNIFSMYRILKFPFYFVWRVLVDSLYISRVKVNRYCLKLYQNTGN